MTSPLASARRVHISEVTIVGHHMVGLSAEGNLFKWHGTRWVRLEVAASPSGKRRPYRYSGHPETARAHA